MKCALCPSFITKDEEIVRFYRLPHHKRKVTAHLRCFINEKFIATVSNECTPSDAVIVKAYEVCAWCRKYGFVVATMSRTGQAICASCNEILQKLFIESNTKQTEISNS